MERTKNDLREEQHAVQEELDIAVIIDDMWRGFKRMWLIMLLLAALCVGVMGFRTYRNYRPGYEAYATFVVSSRNLYGYDANAYDKKAASQLSNTFSYILTSGALRTSVCKYMGVNSLPGEIFCSYLEDTNLITLSVTASDPNDAYEELQAVIECYPGVAEYIIGDTVLTMMDSSGIPKEPKNGLDLVSSVKRGALIGAALCFALLVFYAVSRRTVRRESDLKKYVSVDHLGSVPTVNLKKRSSGTDRVLVGAENSEDSFNESISGIRYRFIRAAEEKKAKCIIVTSASAGEGKTTIAANLAVSLARKKKTVILIDGDLRNPTVADMFGFKPTESSVVGLLKGKTLNEVKGFVYHKMPLAVLPGLAGQEAGKSLIRDDNIGRMIGELQNYCDYLIIDTPPCGVVSDAAAFARCADGAVFVVRQDYSNIDQILQAMEVISDTRTPILGYVINNATVGITGYGHGYGYGYGYGYGHGGYGYGGYGYGKKKYGYGYGSKDGKHSYGYGYKYEEPEDDDEIADEGNDSDEPEIGAEVTDK